MMCVYPPPIRLSNSLLEIIESQLNIFVKEFQEITKLKDVDPIIDGGNN